MLFFLLLLTACKSHDKQEKADSPYEGTIHISVDESFKNPDFDAIHLLQYDIDNACTTSYTSCQICCKPGKGRNDGHNVFVACDEHANRE